MANRMAKKYKEGGEVGGPDIPEERGPVGLEYNKLLRSRRFFQDEERRADNSLPRDGFALRRAAGPGMRSLSNEELAKLSAQEETAKRRAVGHAQGMQRFYEQLLNREGKKINQRRDPTRVEDNGYKKGGLIKKASGGRVRGDGCAIRGKTKGKMV
jgi:hypothetical protein